jgi:hypothetical protein
MLICRAFIYYAGVAQLVERHLAKVKVAGSNLVSRSILTTALKHAQNYKQHANFKIMVPTNLERVSI